MKKYEPFAKRENLPWKGLLVFHPDKLKRGGEWAHNNMGRQERSRSSVSYSTL
jgi:hypothetical protein